MAVQIVSFTFNSGNHAMAREIALPLSPEEKACLLIHPCGEDNDFALFLLQDANVNFKPENCKMPAFHEALRIASTVETATQIIKKADLRIPGVRDGFALVHLLWTTLFRIMIPRQWWTHKLFFTKCNLLWRAGEDLEHKNSDGLNALMVSKSIEPSFHLYIARMYNKETLFHLCGSEFELPDEFLQLLSGTF